LAAETDGGADESAGIGSGALRQLKMPVLLGFWALWRLQNHLHRAMKFG
jgi:hypothetical protein